MTKKHYVRLAAAALAFAVSVCPAMEPIFGQQVKAAAAENDGKIYEDSDSVTVTAAENMSDYPYAQWNVSDASSVVLPAGTTIEYDMQVEEKTFSNLYWETKVGWESPEDYSWIKHLSASDFTESKRHETVTLDKEYKLNDSDASKWGVQVQTGSSDTDYVGVITCSALKITLPGQSGEPAEPESGITVDASKVISVTDDTVGGWPYADFSIANAGTVCTGTIVEYDVKIENTDFAGMYWETDLDWTQIKSGTLTPGEFTDQVAHVTITYVGEPVDVSGIQMKTGGDGTDYRGDITVSNLKITPAKAEEPGVDNESDFEETILFSGSEAVGGETDEEKLKAVYTSGGFNTKKIMEGGYFLVEYTADAKTDIKLALSDWDAADGWKEMSSTESGAGADGTYYAKFSYLACENALGSTDFSVVDAITVKVPEGTVSLTSLKWRGPKLADGSSGSSGSSESSESSGSSGSTGSSDGSESPNKDTDDGAVTEAVAEKNRNQTVSGQDYVVTKSGGDGEAEVAFVEAPENTARVVIPDTITVDGVTCKVTYIAAEAFKGNTKVKTVTIGNNVTKIGDEAFASCTSLKKVTISSSVTAIGEKAFYGCKKLKSISITSTALKSVADKALSGISKKAVIDVPDESLKDYKKLFSAKTGFKKTMKLI